MVDAVRLQPAGVFDVVWLPVGGVHLFGEIAFVDDGTDPGGVDGRGITEALLLEGSGQGNGCRRPPVLLLPAFHQTLVFWIKQKLPGAGKIQGRGRCGRVGMCHQYLRACLGERSSLSVIKIAIRNRMQMVVAQGAVDKSCLFTEGPSCYSWTMEEVLSHSWISQHPWRHT